MFVAICDDWLSSCRVSRCPHRDEERRPSDLRPSIFFMLNLEHFLGWLETYEYQVPVYIWTALTTVWVKIGKIFACGAIFEAFRAKNNLSGSSFVPVHTDSRQISNFALDFWRNQKKKMFNVHTSCHATMLQHACTMSTRLELSWEEKLFGPVKNTSINIALDSRSDR